MLDDTQRLAVETIQKGKQALIFVPSRLSAEKTAEDISKLTNIQHPELESEILKAVSSPTRQCRRLSHCVKKGIAFHHAGLVEKQRELIEKEFREGKIKIICCTPTLAAGISTPAFRVIIKSLKRYSGQWGMDWIPVLEYMQMAGRAGRPEFEKFGEAIVIAKNQNEKEEIYEKYICGQPEEIYSKLAAEPVLRMYLLSLISSGIIRDDKTMDDFFTRTFWAQQFRDMNKLESIMEKMLNLLDGWGFVKVAGKEEEKKGDGFIVASNLDQKGNDENKKETIFRPTMIGKRISELYLDPLTARHILDCLNNWKKDKKSFSLLQMICHTLEMRPLLRIKVREQDFIQEELVKNYDLLLKEEPSAFDLEYGDFMKSIKTALFFESWINEKDEDFLMERYDVRPGEIRAKIEIADWLLYASGELAKISLMNRELTDRELVRELAKLRIRIKYGVKEELLSLLKLKGIGRVRARRLVNNGIKDLTDLKKVNLASLGQIVGKAVAEDVKNQLGEEVKGVKKGTRKGQLSMEKF